MLQERPAGQLGGAHGLARLPAPRASWGAWLRAVDGGGSTGLLGIVSASPSRKTGPGSYGGWDRVSVVLRELGLPPSFLGPPADPEILLVIPTWVGGGPVREQRWRYVHTTLFQITGPQAGTWDSATPGRGHFWGRDRVQAAYPVARRDRALLHAHRLPVPSALFPLPPASGTASVGLRQCK